MIDAHHHLWRVSRGDYSWMDESVAAIARDYLPPDLAAVAGPCGIRGTVLVQAAPTLAETEFLLSLCGAGGGPEILGVVGWIDLAADAAPQLDRIAQPKLKGIRPMLQDIAETGWILQAEVLDGLRAVAARGLAFDALITPRHLDVIAELAGLVPELRMVIDHCAKPVFSGGEPGADWRAGMARLAAFPQVHCKVSGLANEYGAGWSAERLAPVFAHVLKAFGPERLMWGSDWPVLDLAGDYAGWLGAAQDMAAGLTAAERAALFGGTARQFYRLDGEE